MFRLFPETNYIRVSKRHRGGHEVAASQHVSFSNSHAREISCSFRRVCASTTFHRTKIMKTNTIKSSFLFIILLQNIESRISRHHGKGMRRNLISPSDPIASHRVVDYGGFHPFENINKNISNYDRILGGKNKPSNVLSVVKPLRIYLDTSALTSAAITSTAKDSKKVDFLTKYVLPLASNFWKDALNVVPVSSTLHIDRTWCPFPHSTSSALTEAGIADVDLVIFVTANGEECKQNLQYDNVLASSYSCYWDQYDRPIAGNIDICLNRLDDITDQDLSYSASIVKEKVRTSSAGAEALLPQQVATGTNVSNVLCRLSTNLTIVRSDKEGDSSSSTLIDCDTEMNSQNNISSSATPLGEWLSSPSNRVDMIRKKTANIIIHEMAHLLGMTFYDMAHYRDWSTGLPLTPKPNVESVVCPGNVGTIKDLSMPSSKVLQKVSFPNGDSYYQVVTPTVVQVVRNQFQCQTLTGAPLENQPTNPSNCIEAHWEERFFATEALSPVRDGVPQMVTPLTLALLKDTGWYWPNFNVVNASSLGFGVGCEFITNDCIIRNDDSVPTYGKDAFCNIKIGDTSSSNSDTRTTRLGLGCDPSHTHVSRCDLIDYSEPSGTGLTPPPLPFQHFTNPSLGSLTSQANYCPMYSETFLDCTNPTNQYSSDLPQVAFLSEEFGPDSRCFLSDDNRPVCLRIQCDVNKRAIKVYIGPFVLICHTAGQRHILPESDKTFVCPSFSSICPEYICPSNCAGNGVCNPGTNKCECFNPSDTSPGCTGSNPTITLHQSSASLRQSSCLRLTFSLILIVTIVSSLFHFS